jgi:hypothetical protein
MRNLFVRLSLGKGALPHGPNWPGTARRHVPLFVAGMGAVDDPPLPGSAVGSRDIEATFRTG